MQTISQKYATEEALHDKAILAGIEAAAKCVPTPMIVQEHKNPLDNSSPVVREYEPVMEGPCGFAWINIKPGNSRFANYLKKTEQARIDSYYGGVTVWVSGYGQSYERKMAYAAAFAQVLQEAGIKAYSMGRLD